MVASASNDPREQFSQFLLACGKISEDDLLTLLVLQRDMGIPLGRLLVQQGFMQETEVQFFLRKKAEEAIHDLFLWDEGYFKFFSEAPAQERHVPIEMDLTTLMLEGSRRSDEWARIRQVFPSSDTAVQVVPEKLTKYLLEEPVYNRMIQLLEMPRRIADLCLMFHASDYAVSKVLFNLYRDRGSSRSSRCRRRSRRRTRRGRASGTRTSWSAPPLSSRPGDSRSPSTSCSRPSSSRPATRPRRPPSRRSPPPSKGGSSEGDFDIEQVPILLQPLDDLDELSSLRRRTTS